MSHQPFPSRGQRDPGLVALAAAEHRIKTGMAVVGGWLRLLDDDPLLPEASRRRAVAVARERVDALVADLESMLADLRGSSHHEADEPVAVDVLVAATVRRCASLRPARPPRLTPGAPVRVGVPAVEVRDIVEHLLDNAVRLGPDVDVEVAVLETEGHAVIEVRDHGPGFPREVDPTVAFGWRDDRRPGAGMGLYVVHDLAGRIGASVTYLDRDGGGTTARVTIPAA